MRYSMRLHYNTLTRYSMELLVLYIPRCVCYTMRLLTTTAERVMKLCNVPQELLAKQAIIETIPDIASIVVISGVLVGSYYLFKLLKDEFNGSDVFTYVCVMIVAGIGGFAWIAHLLTNIVTAVANPEYAAMVKFAAECAK